LRLPAITSTNVDSSIAKTVNNLSDLTNAQTAASNLGLQYYADNCAGIHNDGTNDDAAALRTCMATMPAGATMNLDGGRTYLLASHTTTDSIYKGSSCELFLRSNQTLKFNGATVNSSSAEGTANASQICAGQPQFNTPGTGGGSPTFIPIGNTVANAVSVTTTTHASAANVNQGDFIYIDCGSNAGDDDVFVGWNQAAATGNATTGVIPLTYPLLKPYSAADDATCGGGSGPRIYDWTTCGGGSCGFNLGPMATDITIDGGGGTLNEGTTSGIVFQGTVGGGIRNLHFTTTGSPNGEFIFANNNHLMTLENNTAVGPGCTGDTNFNIGQFASSLNLIKGNNVTLTGVGCISSGGLPGMKAYGDSEGDEANHWSDNKATILAGGSPDAGRTDCEIAYNTWGETFDHEICYNAVGQGFVDGPAGSPGASGPNLVTNGTYKTAGSEIIAAVDGDQITGNNLTSLGDTIDVFLQGRAQVSNNTINTVNASFGAIGIPTGYGNSGYSSQFGPNTINCIVSSCKTAFRIEDPGSVVQSPLTIAPQTFSGTFTSTPFVVFNWLDVPNLTIASAPGTAGYGPSHTVSSGIGYPALPATCTPGQSFPVVDANSFTPGTCVGGGTAHTLAVCQASNVWECL
jgi:hypothetical protein